jgi:hypothetical protein
VTSSYASVARLTQHLQLTSSVTKRLIRQARTDLEIRLVEASARLRTFLEEELSDVHLRLTPGARAHMERFRSFLLSFYAAKLGYYPPARTITQTGVFDKHVYDIMRDDFECLFEMLVDDGFTSARQTPFLADSGISVVQSVHSFDLRCRYKSLDHPLPLLPEAGTPTTSKRMSWFGRPNKLKPDDRLVSGAALAKATNDWKAPVLKNDLVRAYRTFEETSVINPSRVDRKEKLSLSDGRKVRWILIYAVYQVLRNVTEPPKEVCEIEDIEYHVAISSADLPPWKETRKVESLVRRQTDMARLSLLPELPPEALSSPLLTDIQPDVDYLALTQKSVTEQPSLARASSAKRRSRSLTRTFGRPNSVLTRSLNMFRTPSSTRPTTPANPKTQYHEIVVHGYGNGTNPVRLETDIASDSVGQSAVEPDQAAETAPTAELDADSPLATRSNSHSSKASSRSDSDTSHNSAATSATTADLSLPSPTLKESTSTPASLPSPPDKIMTPTPARGRRRAVMSMLMKPSHRTPSPRRRRPMSVCSPTAGELLLPEYARGYADLIAEEREVLDRDELAVRPLRIQKGWAVTLPVRLGGWGVDEPRTEWENYEGLGGHVEVGVAR